MKYEIKINNPCNHFCNPLLKLANQEYETREEACEAIYAAMYDIISGEYGCEMIDRAPSDYGSLEVCDKDGNNSEPLNPNDDPYSREDALTVEFGEEGVTLREVNDNDGIGPDVDYVAVNERGEIVGHYRWEQGYNYLQLDRYIEKCHEYIMREGYAAYDGVSVSVEEK